MTDPGSPLNRSIGLTGAVRGLIAVVAVIAIVAAFVDGRYGLGIAGLVLLAVAGGAALWLWRLRQSS